MWPPHRLETKYRDIADGNLFLAFPEVAGLFRLETKYRDIADGNHTADADYNSLSLS